MSSHDVNKKTPDLIKRSTLAMPPSVLSHLSEGSSLKDQVARTSGLKQAHQISLQFYMEMLDTTKEYKTIVGSPAYLNLTNLPQQDEKKVQLKVDLDDITSHKGRALEKRNLVDEYTSTHVLTTHYEKTGWNNIPLPLKDLLDVIVKQIVKLDVSCVQRKFTVNERILKVQKTIKELKKQSMLAVAESRHQGLHLLDEVAKQEVKIGEFIEQKVSVVNHNIYQDQLVVKQLKDRIEKRFKEEQEKRNELESDLLDKCAMIKQAQKKFETDFAQLIETNVLQKVNQLLTVTIKDKLVNSDKSVSTNIERKVPVSEYVEELRYLLEEKQNTSYNTLDAMIRSMQKEQSQSLRDLQKYEEAAIKVVQEKLTQTLFSQVKKVADEVSETKFQIVDQRKRADTFQFKITELEKAKKLRDRSSSDEKKNKNTDQSQKGTPNLNTQKNPSSDAGVAFLETKLTDMQIQLKKLKEDFIPKRIERAIETMKEQIRMTQMKTNMQIKTMFLPIQQQIENLRKQSPQGNVPLETTHTQPDKLVSNLTDPSSDNIETTLQMQPVLNIEDQSQKRQSARRNRGSTPIKPELYRQQIESKDGGELLHGQNNNPTTIDESLYNAEMIEIVQIQTHNSDSGEQNGTANQSPGEEGMQMMNSDQISQEQLDRQEKLMEMYVESRLKEELEPIIEKLDEIYELAPQNKHKIQFLENEIKKVDEHYMHCCRAICATQGLVLKDVSALNIHQEYYNFLSKQKTIKRRLKLGQIEGENIFHHALAVGNHLSDEDPASDIASGKEEDLHARGNSSDSQSRNKIERPAPQLIKLKNRSFKIKAALAENLSKKYADDEDPISRMQAAIQLELEPQAYIGRSLDPVVTPKMRKLMFMSAEPILKPSTTTVESIQQNSNNKVSFDRVPTILNQIKEDGQFSIRGSLFPVMNSSHNITGPDSSRNVRIKKNSRRHITTKGTIKSQKDSAGFANERGQVRMSSSNQKSDMVRFEAYNFQ